MTKAKKKRWSEMSLAELREATKRFDKPLPPGAAKQPSPALRAKWERSRRGRSADQLLVGIEPDLLNKVAVYAKQHRLSISEVVALGLKGVLAFNG